jgi:small subunit ribosomal protein S8
MTIQDPIADMLVRIKNAQKAGFKSVEMPSSTIKVAIANVLKEEGYIIDYSVKSHGNKAALSILLKYFHGKPVIAELLRVSKSSLRIYKGCEDLPKVKNGLGIAIISTSQGLMTDQTARARRLGGEIICCVA